jgi:hypothetical protein
VKKEEVGEVKEQRAEVKAEQRAEGEENLVEVSAEEQVAVGETEPEGVSARKRTAEAMCSVM